MTWTAHDWQRGLDEAYRLDELGAAETLLLHGIYMGHCGGYSVHAWPCPTAATVLDKLLGAVREPENQKKSPAEAGLSAGIADRRAESVRPTSLADHHCDWCSKALTQPATDDCVNPEHRSTDATLGLREAGCGCCVIVDSTALTLLRHTKTTASGVNAGLDGSPSGTDEVPDKAKDYPSCSAGGSAEKHRPHTCDVCYGNHGWTGHYGVWEPCPKCSPSTPGGAA